eukprot:scaffold228305_cov36-Tisochrysis_lutea.AAC.1
MSVTAQSESKAVRAESSTSGTPARKWSNTPGVETLTARFFGTKVAGCVEALPDGAPVACSAGAVSGLGLSSHQHRTTRRIATISARLVEAHARRRSMASGADLHTRVRSANTKALP